MLKNLVYISIFTLFVTSLWVGLSIYHNFSSSTISKDLDIQIVPITGSFDTSAIDVLKKKQSLQVSLSDTIITASTSSSSLTTQLNPEQISSPAAKLTVAPKISPILSPTPNASGSASTIPSGFFKNEK